MSKNAKNPAKGKGQTSMFSFFSRKSAPSAPSGKGTPKGVQGQSKGKVPTPPMGNAAKNPAATITSIRLSTGWAWSSNATFDVKEMRMSDSSTGAMTITRGATTIAVIAMLTSGYSNLWKHSGKSLPGSCSAHHARMVGVKPASNDGPREAVAGA